MIRFKVLFFILFSFLFSIQTFAQKIRVHVFTENHKSTPGSDTIYYDFKRPLAWQDFQGKVPAAVPWGAMTASGFSFNSSLSDEGNNIDISVGVYTFFTKHDSWKKPEAHSSYHLEHEQHHFDITRLGAAKLEDEIKKAHFTVKNYRSLLNSIFDKVYNEEIAWQKQYDLETQNSKDSVKQLEWNKKISDEIKKLKSSPGAELSVKE
ncbi:MAG: hypothetical protein KGM16_06395 [Bacteroidota bacterium]|nr:hypothetical protein [Bacteroidota bacterium]